MRSSFVEVSSRLLINACDEGIRYVNTIREEALEEAIDKKMAKRFFRPKSREEARDEIVNEESHSALRFTTYDLIMMRGSYTKSLCQKLKGMAALDVKVYLSREDYESIDVFLREAMRNV